MQISFSDDAFDAFVQVTSALRDGYTVALLNDNEDTSALASSDIVLGTDVRFVSADENGVTYILLDPKTQEPIMDGQQGGAHVRPWEAIARIHVY